MSRVVSAAQVDTCRRVRIAKPHGWKLVGGQSVAVDGICSTVVRSSRDFFEVEYMPETLSKTISGDFQKGTLVNLERSLTLKNFVDGHLVQGHVDARGRVVARVELGRSRELIIAAQKALMKYIAPRGSVAINGVSLTVARAGRTSFTVALIPYTIAHTNIGGLEVGNIVNIEVDMIARYLWALRGHGRVNRDAKKRTRKRR